MKKIICLLVFATFLIACEKETNSLENNSTTEMETLKSNSSDLIQIGIVENGAYSSYDDDILREVWQEELNASGIDVDLVTSFFYEQEGEGVFFLTNNESGSISSGFPVTVIDSNIFISNSLFGTTCESVGCSSSSTECQLASGENGRTICTPCSANDCKRTSSTNTIISSLESYSFFE